MTKSGERRVVSKRLLLSRSIGGVRASQYAPYLDYRPLKDSEPGAGDSWAARMRWISRDLERRRKAMRSRTLCRSTWTKCAPASWRSIDKTEAAVKDRLTKEINYWDHRAEQLKEQGAGGKSNARLNSGEARKRADELQARLQRRMEEIKLERQLYSSRFLPSCLAAYWLFHSG